MFDFGVELFLYLRELGRGEGGEVDWGGILLADGKIGGFVGGFVWTDWLGCCCCCCCCCCCFRWGLWEREALLNGRREVGVYAVERDMKKEVGTLG